MVFQRPTLYPHLNVRANLALQGSGRGTGVCPGFHKHQVAAIARIADAVRILGLGLGDSLDRRPSELSGGQQAAASPWVGPSSARPAVFLLDEPLSNLDSRGCGSKCARELHLLHKRLRATMFYVTHDQEEALALGDRIAVMDRGTMQQVDRPDVVYEPPRQPLCRRVSSAGRG